MPVNNGAGRRALLGAVCAAILLGGCADPQSPGGRRPEGKGGTVSPSPASPAPGASLPRPAEIPALGPATRARIEPTTEQALVVMGDGRDSDRSTAVLYERDPVRGWQAVSTPWPAHNALRGWTDHHRAGDLRSPIGVFGLRDAGGRLPDPGTRLPYDRTEEFNMPGTGFLGEPLEGSFDHVIAIDYNRTPGTTPLDKTRPLGLDKGGGVWVHVDHGGPTRACISLPRERMRQLLQALDPDKNPVIVMGDTVALAR
ncbi:hypothetical protein [Streptomyces sp. SP18CS02]|uniref:hypothetical protein n=1 Tax=Streptomyces sp. SP18CS02 TaxID=3002531 RepID=UPI002E79251F|nr:hypothetical protein [Streptomyces sp. SP18CS02]MEE1753966.1 hypothetical protein [Streptomyces sp. SP18CS02]